MTKFVFSTIDRGRTKTYNSSTATTRNASYGNRTHVNSLEGYYATTTPTMLDNAATKLKPVLIKGSPDDNFCLQHPWHQEQSQWQYLSSALLTEEEPKLTIHRLQQQEMHRTGIEPMSIAWKATMLPLHQRCLTMPQKIETCTDQGQSWQFLSSAPLTSRATTRSTIDIQFDRNNKKCIVIEPMSIAWKATMLPLHQRCLTMPQPNWNLYWSRAVPMTIFVFSTLDIKSNHRWQNLSSAPLTEEEPKLTIHRLQQQEMHRTGIEPMSIAWKATMLPLHQRCLTMPQPNWNLYWSRAVPMTIFVFSTLDIKSNHNDNICLQHHWQRKNQNLQFIDCNNKKCIVRESNPCQ